MTVPRKTVRSGTGCTKRAAPSMARLALLGGGRRARVGVQHDAIQPKEAEDGQRLVAQPLDDHAAPLGAHPLVERHQRPDPGAVDHAQRRQVDFDQGRLRLDQLLEIRTQIRDRHGVELPFDRQMRDATGVLDLESHEAPSVLRDALERSTKRLLKVSRLGRPGRYAISMNDCMMKSPRPDSGSVSNFGLGTSVGSNPEPQSRSSIRIWLRRVWMRRSMLPSFRPAYPCRTMLLNASPTAETTCIWNSFHARPCGRGVTSLHAVETARRATSRCSNIPRSWSLIKAGVSSTDRVSTGSYRKFEVSV